jgi:hypothetical protein
MATYHLMNEIVENGPFVGPTVDPIADIYIFDIGGIILFSFDGVNRLFSDELRMADWSLQPSFVPGPWTLQNNGQYFSIRWKLPFAEQYSLFYYFGLRGLVGASREISDGEAISAGIGMRAVQLKTLDPTTNLQTVELRFNAGLFYDRDNSLLASLMLSDYADNAVTLNVYPGVVKFGGFTPGLWLLWSKNDGFIVGFTTVWAPGLGVRLR